MRFNFSKMHGLGNDFMVIDTLTQSIPLSSELIQKLSHRHTGIGFDQCLVVEKSILPGIDFNYRIFNADGEEVGQCGNGARCLARYIQAHGLSNKTELIVKTKTTQLKLVLHEDHSVSVDMGIPNFLPSEIPFKARIQENEYPLQLENHTLKIHALSLGNPHAIVCVDNIDTAPVDNIGQAICHHPLFPEQVNVGFMQILNSQHIALRVYERGCGETLACGSGAAAAVVAGRQFHHLDKTVQVSLPGGNLEVTWPNEANTLTLRGPAEFVYHGRTCD